MYLSVVVFFFFCCCFFVLLCFFCFFLFLFFCLFFFFLFCFFNISFLLFIPKLKYLNIEKKILIYLFTKRAVTFFEIYQLVDKKKYDEISGLNKCPIL